MTTEFCGNFSLAIGTPSSIIDRHLSIVVSPFTLNFDTYLPSLIGDFEDFFEITCGLKQPNFRVLGDFNQEKAHTGFSKYCFTRNFAYTFTAGPRQFQHGKWLTTCLIKYQNFISLNCSGGKFIWVSCELLVCGGWGVGPPLDTGQRTLLLLHFTIFGDGPNRVC